MVSEWFESSRTMKSAIVLTGVNFFIFLTAFFSPYWLQSVPSEELPEPKFLNLGKETDSVIGMYWLDSMYYFIFS